MDNANILMDLYSAYNEPNRHYHNLGHIGRMFWIAKEQEILLSEDQIIAIWFHDVVYNVPRLELSNEILSAQEALRYLSGILHDDFFINNVVTIIKDTEKELPSINESEIVIDLDLFDLADDQRYKSNGILIRKEYACFNDEEFKRGRIAWINSMLERKSIYVSKKFNTDEMNGAARSNLTRELLFLERGINLC